MAIETIRTDVVSELLTIPGLGGSEQRVTKYWYETDDLDEFKTFWETTVGPTPSIGSKVINATMLRRTSRIDEEKVAGKEFARVHNLLLRFRYGKKRDPLGEKTFESFVEAISEKLLNNKTIFRREGLHPEDEGKQAADVTLTQVKPFHIRVWQADFTFVVVERIFC